MNLYDKTINGMHVLYIWTATRHKAGSDWNNPKESYCRATVTGLLIEDKATGAVLYDSGHEIAESGPHPSFQPAINEALGKLLRQCPDKSDILAAIFSE